MDATVKSIVQFFMDTVTAGESLAGSSCSLDDVERDRMRKGNELTQKLLAKLEEKCASMKVSRWPSNKCDSRHWSIRMDFYRFGADACSGSKGRADVLASRVSHRQVSFLQ
jgi:hypothetical protein